MRQSRFQSWKGLHPGVGTVDNLDTVIRHSLWLQELSSNDLSLECYTVEVSLHIPPP